MRSDLGGAPPGDEAAGSDRALRILVCALAALYVVCFAISPRAAFFEPVEGASWTLMSSLESRWWTAASLQTASDRIDPQGAFADPFARARGGRWYSKAPPLLPLAASFPFAILGAIGAYAVPAGSAVAAAILASRLARRVSPGKGSGWGAVAAVAATPLVVHGALFCGHVLAAALALAAILLVMDAAARGFPLTVDGRGRALASLVCAVFATLAQPEAIWLYPASLAAWAILREGRPRIDVSEGPRWSVAFLALVSVLAAAAAIFASRFGIGPATPEAGGPRWGSPILIPVIAPAVLAAHGLARLAMRASPARASRLRAVWACLVAAGIILQAAGLAEAESTRLSHARAAEAVARAADAGDAVLSDVASVPGILAGLALERPLLYLRPDGPVEAFLSAASAGGLRAFAAVSAVESGDEGLASRRALGAFLREGEPVREGGFLIARFVGEGSSASHPSRPPRGD